MNSYRLKYKGSRTINAVKMVRRHTGLTLNESLKAVRHSAGFVVNETVANDILHDYFQNGLGPIMSRVNSWDVFKLVDLDEPIDLRVFDPVTPL